MRIKISDWTHAETLLWVMLSESKVQIQGRKKSKCRIRGHQALVWILTALIKPDRGQTTFPIFAFSILSSPYSLHILFHLLQHPVLNGKNPSQSTTGSGKYSERTIIWNVIITQINEQFMESWQNVRGLRNTFAWKDWFQETGSSFDKCVDFVGTKSNEAVLHQVFFRCKLGSKKWQWQMWLYTLSPASLLHGCNICNKH